MDQYSLLDNYIDYAAIVLGETEETPLLARSLDRMAQIEFTMRQTVSDEMIKCVTEYISYPQDARMRDILKELKRNLLYELATTIQSKKLPGLFRYLATRGMDPAIGWYVITKTPIDRTLFNPPQPLSANSGRIST